MSITVEEYVDRPESRPDADPTEVATAFLARIAEREDLAAVVSVGEDRAAQDVARVLAARRSGRPLPLDGMPILVKDNIDVAELPCRVGSPLFADKVADSDAESVRRLSDAGAVVLGKATLHELVYGGTTDSPFYGRTKNPWDLSRIVGGSSGGSGAAVAAGLCVVALGSDTGGSIRLPGHLNGVVGSRPTYGSISVRGSQPIGASLDTIGPLARHARDAAITQAVMTGRDWADPWSVDLPPAPRTGMTTAAVLDDETIGEVEPGVRARCEDAVAALRQLGVRTRSEHLAGFAQARADAGQIVRIEAYALYAEELAATPEKFSEETTARLCSGAGVPGEDVMRAVWRIAAWRQQVQALLAGEVDLIVLPSVPVVAPVAGSAGMIAATALLTSLTLPISAAHVPAVSVPCGLADGLPVGVQLVVAPGRDQELLALAAQLQSLLPPPWPPGRTENRSNT